MPVYRYVTVDAVTGSCRIVRMMKSEYGISGICVGFRNSIMAREQE